MENKAQSWHPIITEGLAQDSWDAIFSIALDLPKLQTPDLSLSSGLTGFSLFYCYLAKATSRPEYDDLKLKHLEEAIEAMPNTDLEPGLFKGFTGIAFALSLIQGAEQDLCEEINDAIEEYLEPLGQEGDHFDLLFGLVGLGVYALEQLPKRAARRCLERIIAHLASLAQRFPEGLAWPCPPEYYSEAPPYNLGIAHGSPGIIAFLGRVYHAGIEREQTKKLLSEALSWLFSKKLPSESASFFSSHWGPSSPEQYPARCAWCYGDPGVAAALFVAAHGLQDTAIEREAILIAQKAALRRGKDSGVVDASLCHGAAGLAHIFNRFYQQTQDELFREASLFWFRTTLSMRNPGKGIGGFLAWKPEGWENNPGLLVGASGIGLALLAGLSSVEPVWDRMLLLSPYGNEKI